MIKHFRYLLSVCVCVTDITDYNCQVTCFEIGSRGYISSRNHSSLYTLHKFIKPGIKLSKFKENISALSVYSSYHIFITRKEELFVEPPYLLPPFEDNWSIWTKQHYEQYYVVETNCVQPCLKSILWENLLYQELNNLHIKGHL
jgi:hypothetical protein